MTELQLKRTISSLQPINDGTSSCPGISYVTGRTRKRLGDVVVCGKTRVGTDYVNQYSCIFDPKMIKERRVSCSKVRQQESVPAEMLSNLERAKAGNYFLDLTYGL